MKHRKKKPTIQKIYIGLTSTMLIMVLANLANATTNQPYQITSPVSFANHPGLQSQTLLNSGPRVIKRLRNKLTATTQTVTPLVAGQQLYQSFTANRAANRPVAVNQKASTINPAQQNNLNTLNAQQKNSGGVKVSFNRSNGTPIFIKPQGGSIRPTVPGLNKAKPDKKAIARQFLFENRALLKLDDPQNELNIIHESSDAQGKTHIRFQQLKNGVPLWGKQAIVHLDENDGVYLFQGRYEPTPGGLKTTPTISAQDSVDKVRADLNISQTLSKPAKSELVIYTQKDRTSVLTFKVEISPAIDKRWIYFVNAATGAITHKIFNIHKNVVSASGTDLNSINRTFNVWSQSGYYYLIDPSTPSDTPANPNPVTDGPQATGDTYILSANNGDGSNLYYITHPSLTGWQDASAVSAAYNTRLVYDYYLNTHSRHSIDGNNKNLMVAIHFEQAYDNAFWNGTFMVYGDGGTYFSPLAGCLDVAGHEMTHGVIETSANLIYENQSGALNESFADVFGAMIDRNDWRMGEDCTIANPGFLRDMSKPASGLSPQPAHMDQYQNLPNTPDGDNGGVHVNSGIPNRAAYLIAEGLSAESLGTSIGRSATEHIYYRALTTYLTQSSQFVDARRALIQAAEDLHGQGSTQSQAVAMAFDAVGITDSGTPPDNSPTPTDPVNGDDVMVYLWPADGTHDYDPNDSYALFVQTMGGADVGPYNDPAHNDKTAAYTKPAAYTGTSGTEYYYIATDNNVYYAVLGGTDIAMTSTGVFYSIAMSPNGRYVAYTSTLSSDNNLYLIDLDNGGTISSHPIIPQDYTGDTTVTANTILFADSLAFDYTSNNIVFDALNCLSTPTSTCDSGAGYRYWSIGVFEVSSTQLSFPFPNQSPDIDLGYPSFAANNNFVIAMDRLDFTAVSSVSSATITVDFENQNINTVNDFSSDFPSGFWSVPTFWGADDFITIQAKPVTNPSVVISASHRAIDTNWQGTGNLEEINAYAVAMPVMHRKGVRILSGGLTPTPSALNYGDTTKGNPITKTLKLTNLGNSDVNITNITINNSDFIHNGVNTRVPRGQAISFAVTYLANKDGTQAASLMIDNDGKSGKLVISLTGTVGVASGGGSDGNSGSSGGGIFGCTLSTKETNPDPILLLLIVASLVHMLRKRLIRSIKKT